CYSCSRSWTAKLRRMRTRQALTAPSSIVAEMPAMSALRMPSIVAAARVTARPTASSIEFVEVPVRGIVFSTIPRSSIGGRRRREALYAWAARHMQVMLASVTSRLLLAIALATLPAAVPAAPLDPSADGPFAVGVTTLTLVDATRGRTLVTEVWY